MKQELTKNQSNFKNKILNELKPELQWVNDCINIRIDFKDEEQFHIHIIEDDICHLHVRGILCDDGSLLTIKSIRNNSVSQDTFNTTMDFLNDLF